ncbi:UDP-glucose 4-epimerase family protein [Pseudomonas sp. BGr12]|uniref:UDP-glucose 4-epimerase family protein n=1 Tax=unclassified Pseudomonas TaxID=196821 RepID=UPI00177DFB14|nr:MULTISPECIES: SDR family oxidoreductase [unclassified Pseudomonas]MBD9575182.1 SDR family oxidoreductase [Pseudomonas sp. PDM23]MBD9669876.1 SDR family oxidoreductase [Pseudomonas sp. PDM21]MDL2427825.1 SDR family oxidoreductase [Pseudomonas sp. BJa5]
MKVLLTGASGFVGRGVLARLCQEDHVQVRVAQRGAIAQYPEGVEVALIDGLSVAQSWMQALQGVDVVIHCAARVHVMDEQAADPLAEFRAVNVEATRHLAQQAAAAGAKRFVFVSSIKVNGEETAPGHPFTADAEPKPQDPYGQSKLEAEQALFDVARQTGLEVAVVRPPLVYGPGVKANFASLMRALQRRLPLPFGSIDNRRSLVARDNLVDLLLLCARHPAAAGQVFLVSDGEDLSTAQLCRGLSKALGVRPRLLPVPAALLRLLGLLAGRSQQVQRLLGSLQVDISTTRSRLGWTPPVSVEQALRAAAQGCGQEQGR